MLSGYSLHGSGLELDAIAAVVIGGTLLRGGIGYVAGTFVGVLILGVIQTLIVFDGTLSSWWTRIVAGALLLVFCLLQQLLERRRRARMRRGVLSGERLRRQAGHFDAGAEQSTGQRLLGALLGGQPHRWRW